MEVIYVSRDQLGLPPVGHNHDVQGVRRGYPYRVPPSKFTRLNIHHTVIVMGDYDHDGYLNGDMDDIRQYMRRLMTVRQDDLGPEVPYSFVIFEHPNPNVCIVAEGRGVGRVGAHTKGNNSMSYGVAFAGNTSTRDITPGMVAGVRFCGRFLANPTNSRETRPHSFYKATACPGVSATSKLTLMQPPFTDPIRPTPAEVCTLELTLPILKIGLQGNTHVRKVQSILNILIGAALTDDGHFGPKTEAAIKQFQRGLKFTTVNGIVDEDTWRALLIVPTT